MELALWTSLVFVNRKLSYIYLCFVKYRLVTRNCSNQVPGCMTICTWKQIRYAMHASRVICHLRYMCLQCLACLGVLWHTRLDHIVSAPSICKGCILWYDRRLSNSRNFTPVSAFGDRFHSDSSTLEWRRWSQNLVSGSLVTNELKPTAV